MSRIHLLLSVFMAATSSKPFSFLTWFHAVTSQLLPASTLVLLQSIVYAVARVKILNSKLGRMPFLIQSPRCRTLWMASTLLILSTRCLPNSLTLAPAKVFIVLSALVTQAFWFIKHTKLVPSFGALAVAILSPWISFACIFMWLTSHFIQVSAQ